LLDILSVSSISDKAFRTRKPVSKSRQTGPWRYWVVWDSSWFGVHLKEHEMFFSYCINPRTMGGGNLYDLQYMVSPLNNMQWAVDFL